MSKSTKRKKVDKYSIIVIPKDHAKVKRWEVSRRSIELAAVVILVLAFSYVASIWGFVHFRNGYIKTKSLRLENAAFDKEKAIITSRLESLELAVERTQRFASKVEEAAGLTSGGVAKGIGPLTEGDELPLPSSRFSLDNLTVGAEDDKLPKFKGFAKRLEQLEEEVAQVEERLHTVYEFHQDRLFYWASIPSIWPVRGLITSGFGPRRRPIRGGTTMHEGIDIAAPVGTKVVAAGDGVVTYSGYRRGLGKTVIIDHGFGVTTIYGHNSENYVKEGDKVKRGMVIAAVGMTGVTTGPHLHYQVEVDGIPVDPMRYIVEDM